MVKKAGCILYNKEENKIGLVYREKENDYTFPKGHLEEGETLIECAIRETIEETGRECHLLNEEVFASIEYENSKEGKIIVYMYLAIDDGPTTKEIKEEDKETLVWVDIDKVYDILTYDDLKESWEELKEKIFKIIK